MALISYRTFSNADPPRLVDLWHACQLGRGAATGFSTDAFEFFNFSQRYFDRRGLIVATNGSQDLVGMAHAGFGPNAEKNATDHGKGVICATLVRPEYRRQGVGRELVGRAETYLHQSGATAVLAGPAAPYDPFYVGIYGGSRPTGFLESDADASPFFGALGYEAVERYAVLQRPLTGKDPVNFRLATLRRKTELVVDVRPRKPNWWWVTRYGRMETLRFVLRGKAGGPTYAAVTVVGLDLYLPRWRERVIGMLDVEVVREHRRKGYGQMLIAEVCRRLREELINLAEVHVSEANAAGLRLFQSVGFKPVDAGVVYRKVLADAAG
ncbi:MAG: GNAT family N-acetyltransferase [Planctomycetota bacterium]